MTILGTEVLTLASGTASPAAITLTIPSGTTRVYIPWSFDGIDGTSGDIASATLATGTLAVNTSRTTGAGYSCAAGLLVFTGVSSGSRNLTITWTAAPSEGPTGYAVYTDETGTIEDADHDAQISSTACSVTLTTTAGSTVYKFDQRYTNGSSSPPPLSTGWTNLNTDWRSSESTRLSYQVAAGTSTVCNAEGEDYSSVVAWSVQVAGGGGSEYITSAGDTISFSDSAAASTTLSAAGTDTLTLSDSAIAAAQLTTVGTDTLSFTDSASALAVLVSTGTDTATFTDSAIAAVTLVAVAADSATFTDAAVGSVTSGAIAVGADTVSFTDSSSALIVAVAAGSDTLSLSDSAIAALTAAATASDSVGLSDSAVASVNLVATGTDTVSFTDSALAALGNPPIATSAEDTITLSDEALASVTPYTPPAAGVLVGGGAKAKTAKRGKTARELIEEIFDVVEGIEDVQEAENLLVRAEAVKSPTEGPDLLALAEAFGVPEADRALKAELSALKASLQAKVKELEDEEAAVVTLLMGF